MSVEEVTDTLKQRSFKRPNTILGFFAIVLGILGTTAAIITGILARSPSLEGYIPWILVFVAVFFVGVVGGVFITSWKDPTALMLGQISGQDYLANRRLTLGDSEAGEYSETISTVPNIRFEAEVLPPSKATEGE